MEMIDIPQIGDAINRLLVEYYPKEKTYTMDIAVDSIIYAINMIVSLYDITAGASAVFWTEWYADYYTGKNIQLKAYHSYNPGKSAKDEVISAYTLLGIY